MLETATVIKINNNTVTLTCSDSEHCNSCAAHGVCGGTQDKTFEAWNSQGFDLEKGGRVEVYLPTGKTIGAAFMVMIFPLLMFFAGFYGVSIFFPEPIEGVRVLAGVIGIAAGFGINFLINKKPSKKNMPQITRKIF